MQRLPEAPFVLLEDSRSSGRSNAGLLFSGPVRIISCSSYDMVDATLEDIEIWRAKGYYLAGWIAYEAAYPFHPTLKKDPAPLSEEPLIWMGVFKAPTVLSSDHLNALFSLEGKRDGPGGLATAPKALESESQFGDSFKRIMSYITAGDVYQINHTFRQTVKTFGAAKSLFSNLRRVQPVPFGALIETGPWKVLSLSPELFIERRGKCLTSRPMKGTAKPGRTLAETEKAMEYLHASEKDRAENVMIVDLIRNDFSKVCEPGTVEVPKLFEVERFSSVLQMSSEVTGKLKPGTGFLDIFRALFPCGSITGAPKIRAMEIIRETEIRPRGIYTGALGFIAPSGDFTFSVPIRTLVLDRAGEGWLGIGSGLVEASDPRAEYEECLLKGSFLKKTPKDFALIETMLWTPGEGFRYLGEHLARLEDSARYFGFACDPLYIKSSLEDLAGRFKARNRKRLRLTLNRSGSLSFEVKDLPAPTGGGPVRIKLSEIRVDSRNPFLFHKTTERQLYELELRRARDQGFYEVVFMNEKGEITEGAFNSVFVDTGTGPLATPPLECGLLPGVLRRNLIESGQAKPTSLTCDELLKAKTLKIGNSVTGLLPAKLEATP